MKKVTLIIFILISWVLFSKGIEIKINHVIGKAIEEYFYRAYTLLQQKYDFMIIKIDTPGGLLLSTEKIIKKILSTSKPIIVFITPKGGGAVSAGAFISISSHYLIMEQGTRIGAAHPVTLFQKPDKIMEEKIMKDTLSLIKNICEIRHRDFKTIKLMIEKSESYTEKEAYNKGICNLIVKDEQEFLEKLKTLKIDGKPLKYKSPGDIEKLNMTFREKFFATILSPDVAFQLLVLGSIALFFEITSPGIGLPGVVGVICILLGLYALSVLPVNYVGLLLIISSMVFFVLEIKLTAHGILALGATAALILGGMILFNSPLGTFRVSMGTLIFTAVVAILFFLVIVERVIAVYRKKEWDYQHLLMGKAVKDFKNGEGVVLAEGELWSAKSSEEIKKGEEVIIKEKKGNFIYVIKKEG